VRGEGRAARAPDSLGIRYAQRGHRDDKKPGLAVGAGPAEARPDGLRTAWSAILSCKLLDLSNCPPNHLGKLDPKSVALDWVRSIVVRMRPWRSPAGAMPRAPGERSFPVRSRHIERPTIRTHPRARRGRPACSICSAGRWDVLGDCSCVFVPEPKAKALIQINPTVNRTAQGRKG
jgi:hypothetical protein